MEIKRNTEHKLCCPLCHKAIEVQITFRRHIIAHEATGEFNSFNNDQSSK